MSYENMSIVELLRRWNEASADLAPDTNWMHHDAARRSIKRCIAELTQRGYFDRATVHPAPQEKVLVGGRGVEID
jgi:hypothetical protein